MNRTTVAALALYAALAANLVYAADVQLKVTPYEAGLDGKPGTTPAALVAEDVKAGPKFVIAATVTVEDEPVWVGRYRGAGPFDDKAACETYMASAEYQSSRDGLEAVAKQRFHPDAKVGVSCKELPAE